MKYRAGNFKKSETWVVVQNKYKLKNAESRRFICPSLARYFVQRTGLGVVGGFEKRPPGTKAQLKN